MCHPRTHALETSKPLSKPHIGSIASTKKPFAHLLLMWKLSFVASWLTFLGQGSYHNGVEFSLRILNQT